MKQQKNIYLCNFYYNYISKYNYNYNYMNIIIPIGGKGERFKNEGYNLPKPLINIFGKPMILHVIDNLNVEDNDTIYIIYNRELNEYNFKGLFCKRRKEQIKFIELNKQTDGAVETVLIGLNTFDLIELEKKIVILDCDTFYSVDILSIYRLHVENSIFCFYDFQDKPIYSYLLVNNNGYITEIKEKVKISTVANSGCYCFKNGNVLFEYCNRIINGGIKKEESFIYHVLLVKCLKMDAYLMQLYWILIIFIV